MSLIDWSDPEQMFGLLIDYVAAEHNQAEEPIRRAFLWRLKSHLETLQDTFESSPLVEAVHALRGVRNSIPAEFEADVVVEHLSDCIEELERVQKSSLMRAEGSVSNG